MGLVWLTLVLTNMLPVLCVTVKGQSHIGLLTHTLQQVLGENGADPLQVKHPLQQVLGQKGSEPHLVTDPLQQGTREKGQSHIKSVNHYTTYSKSLGNKARTNGSVYFSQGVSDLEEVVNPYFHAATNTVNPLHVSSII